MSVLLEDIESVPNGATFFTADLHIHSFGGSHDVKDVELTPERIIDTAAKHRVSLIAITDHNQMTNTLRSIEYARKYSGNLLVLAAVEISTANGHLLVYFSSDLIDNLAKLLYSIDLVNPETKNGHTAKSMADVIKEAERLGGLCIAAHIDRVQTGFEALASGYPNWKKDILNSSGLYGIEFDDDNHLCWYSEEDEPTSDGGERKKLVAQRARTILSRSGRFLAHVQNSDSHTLANFEANISARHLTRYKMDSLSFDGFRTALIDPEARVRAVRTIPKAFPKLRGLHISGGFLDGSVFHFSDNLSCFIGGRGAGKSTALQSLAYGLGIRDSLAENDNCPTTVVVYGQDADGVMYRYERHRGGEAQVQAKEAREILDVPADSFKIEFYGQNDLSEVARDPLHNSSLLQDFLDRHISLEDLRLREDELLSILEQQGAQLTPLETRAQQRAKKAKAIAEIDKKLEIAESGNLKEIATAQTRLGAEKGLAGEFKEVSAVYQQGLSLNNWLRNFEKMKTNAGPLTDNQHSKVLLAEISQEIQKANALIGTEQTVINTGLAAASAAMAAALGKLRAVHTQTEQSLSEKVLELQRKGLSGNISELQILIKNRATLVAEIARIDNESEELDRLRRGRRENLSSLEALRRERLGRRKKQLPSINRSLSRVIDDYQVFLHYDDEGLVEDFKAFIMGCMQGTYFQEDVASRFVRATTPAKLSSLLWTGNLEEIGRIAGIGDQWAQTLSTRLLTWTNIFGLEVVDKAARPVITVKLKSPPNREIPINQLSDGQKHTILLTIAVLSDSSCPIVIDQPEDDLDNAYIFSSLVRNLREVKERRQVILITHNANIAVLGDAELLFPMKRVEDRGSVSNRGSIDRSETKQSVQDILEGGETAFKRRMEIYGY